MTGLLIGALCALGGLFLGVCSDMISEEMRTRLDRLPQALVRLAARRLPEEIRDDMAREWLAELHVVLHGADAVPVTRLVKGVAYGFSLFVSARKFGREFGVQGGNDSVASREASASTNPMDEVIAKGRLVPDFDSALRIALRDFDVPKGALFRRVKGSYVYEVVSPDGRPLHIDIDLKNYMHRSDE
ncbi:hypothetical protein AB0I72_19860 [Nocardiopsis sp. NPDC049922]|uniref:hypothetical protein n=1 Tax=Nocardiopsis sp. NPDC049922 TaxID=3155157 RepID=UPI0033DF6D77